MTIPSWVENAVCYQIFPDRFANGDHSIDPPNVESWGAPPTIRGYQGGDLEGIRQKLDYLAELGINTLYLNPIFQSPSNHRYHTYDYYRIDPWLGDMKAFKALLKDAHQRKMHILLDGVFNHCARGFFAFSDILENDADSPYRNWFHVRRFPLRAYSPGHARNYEAWWGMKPLPKFNTSNPAARRYLLDAARYWIDEGADGWRLDVPNEIDDDDFWAEFRSLVRSANPEAYLVGEIWNVWPRWANDTHFDGLMNYPLRTALLDYLSGKITTLQFAEHVEMLLTVYPRENVYAMLNLMDSHDTERALTYLGGDAHKVALAFQFVFGYPGVPCVYYGDEVGLAGGKDPDSRRAFPWDEQTWNHDLRQHIQKLAAVRKDSPALTRGDYRPLLASNTENCYAFARIAAEETVIVAINGGGAAADIAVPVAGLLEDQHPLHSLMDDRTATVEGGSIHLKLDAWSGIYLRA
ncbi:MAG TPA: glycoside hydrolase family 13 protein [Anaerolineaceae bacterium]